MMVARPFVPYHAATRTGCSARRYHCAVMIENNGRHPASKIPRKKRLTSRLVKLRHAGVRVCAIPQPSTSTGMRMRCGTLTMRMDEKGCHSSWATGAMEPTMEYWFPVRLVSSRRPKMAL